MDLHSLPVAYRIDYRIALLTYMALTANQPAYLSDLLNRHTPVRQLRSDGHNRLLVPFARLSFANRVFRSAAPTIWNSLPYKFTENLQSLLVFRRNLNTYFLNDSLLADQPTSHACDSPFTGLPYGASPAA
jgi:hypothetical protein